MSYYLHGPFSFDPKTVSAGARTALSSVGGGLREIQSTSNEQRRVELMTSFFRRCGPGREEGLYVLLQAPQSIVEERSAAQMVQALKDPGVPVGRKSEISLELSRQIKIAGFWVVFGLSYLEDGTSGPPDRFPPYARGLLDAATEEVWWRTLNVAPLEGNTWRPVIVLEWPPYLSSRGGIAPPGFARASDLNQGAGSSEGFLSFNQPDSFTGLGGFGAEPPPPEPEAAPPPPTPVQAEEEAPVPWSRLSRERSAVVVIQGEMTWDSNIHRGEFALVPPHAFVADPGGEEQAIPRERWLAMAANSEVPLENREERHSLGHPLELGRAGVLADGQRSKPRIGFPMSAWYTRGLQVWPLQPNLVAGGDLTDRVVQSKWKGQAALAIASTVAVLVLVLSVSVGVQFAAEPHPQASAETPLPAAQPAMSVCSADHQKYVDEFRCQIRAMGTAGPEGTPAGSVCGDPGSTEQVTATYDDLQAHFCGLLDREQDDWRGNLVGGDPERFYNFGRLAAAQACFNVLGHPHPYAQSIDFTGGARKLGDPALFLDDPALGISSLIDLVRDLEDACDAYENRLERRVEGAILASHVGAPLGSSWEQEREPSRLRRRLLDVATNGMPDDADRCLRLGASEGLDATDYKTLCGAPDKGDRRQEKKKIWLKLGGSPELSFTTTTALISRYTEARFGGKPSEKTSTLWRCHQQLDVPPDADVRTEYVSTVWDLSIPKPPRYDISGRRGLSSQLRLDSALWAIEEDGLDAGVCWQVVTRSLTSYTKVHPLLTALDEEGWPTVEQQLCGQVCGSLYRIAESPSAENWVTRGEDLGLCIYGLDPSRPDLTATVDADGEEKTERQIERDLATRDRFLLGRGQVDQLRLPWNGTRRSGWLEPTLSGVCAFNLVAQDYMPAGDEGYLVGGKAPPLWAGESVQGYGIAGGQDGLAYLSAENLSSYGRSRSTNTCGHAAAQCFTTILLDITGGRWPDGSYAYERYEWFDQWITRVNDLATATPLTINEFSPWCKLVQPYMSVEGDLPEGQIDLPCAIGVSEALQNAETSLTFLSAETIQ